MESAGDASQHGESEHSPKTNLHSGLGTGCTVKIVGPGEIARSEGKAVRVIDNRRI